MRFILIKFFLIVFGSLSLCAQAARKEGDSHFSKQQGGLKNLGAHHQQFLNLPEEKKLLFIKHVKKAKEYFAKKRVIDSLSEIRKAEAVFPHDPVVMSLRGSCYVHLRDFDSAEHSFKNALELSPNSFPLLFNIAEVHFVTARWKSCYQKFEALLNDEKNAGNSKEVLRLIEFKMLLCQIKMGQKKEAKERSNKYDTWDDTPYYYYSKAAVLFDEGQKIEADVFLRRARRVFSKPEATEPWDDTLREYGYIKSFYGGDEEE